MVSDRRLLFTQPWMENKPRRDGCRRTHGKSAHNCSLTHSDDTCRLLFVDGVVSLVPFLQGHRKDGALAWRDIEDESYVFRQSNAHSPLWSLWSRPPSGWRWAAPAWCSDPSVTRQGFADGRQERRQLEIIPELQASKRTNKDEVTVTVTPCKYESQSQNNPHPVNKSAPTDGHFCFSCAN